MANRDFGQLAALLQRIEQRAREPGGAAEAAAQAVAVLTVLGSPDSIERIEDYILAHQENPAGPGFDEQQIEQLIGMITTMRIIAEILGFPFLDGLHPPG